MAKTTITNELAAKYKEFDGRAGETVDASEVQSVVSAHEDDQETDEEAAAKASTTEGKTAKSKAKTAKSKAKK